MAKSFFPFKLNNIFYSGVFPSHFPSPTGMVPGGQTSSEDAGSSYHLSHVTRSPVQRLWYIHPEK